VASRTLVRFEAARAEEKRKCSKHRDSRKARSTVPASMDVNVTSSPPDDDVWKRIEALKQRPARSVQPSKQFEYDPDQLLRLVENTGRNKISQ
jgi:hypothetical protein